MKESFNVNVNVKSLIFEWFVEERRSRKSTNRCLVAVYAFIFHNCVIYSFLMHLRSPLEIRKQQRCWPMLHGTFQKSAEPFSALCSSTHSHSFKFESDLELNNFGWNLKRSRLYVLVNFILNIQQFGGQMCYTVSFRTGIHKHMHFFCSEIEQLKSNQTNRLRYFGTLHDSWKRASAR